MVDPTLNLFMKQQNYAVARDGVSTLRTPYTDQVAFRESYFVYRNELSEYLLPILPADEKKKKLHRRACMQAVRPVFSFTESIGLRIVLRTTS